MSVDDPGPASPLKALQAGLCWWCDAPADSREHRHKRSDIAREHGGGPYTDDAVLSILSAHGRRSAKGPKSKSLKFAAGMCARCNGARSQPFDDAYDQFIEHLHANEAEVLDARGVELSAIWAAAWPERAHDMLRYFVKHACSRIAELTTEQQPTHLPVALLDFLDGGQLPPCLGLRFTSEPVQVMLEADNREDPMWKRWMGFDDMRGDVDRPGSWWSRWRYGWLTCEWGIDPAEQGPAAALGEHLDMPVVASQFSRGTEWAFACGMGESDAPGEAGQGTSASSEEGQTPAGSGRADGPEDELVADDPPVWLHPRNRLETVDAFFDGLLDADFAVHHGGPPDERLNPDDGERPPVDEAAELLRARQLVACCEGWLAGDFSTEGVRRRSAQPVPFDIVSLNERSERLQAALPADALPPTAVAWSLASMALLCLARAHDLGVDVAEGRVQVLDACGFAGKCLAFSAHAHGCRGGAYRSVLD